MPKAMILAAGEGRRMRPLTNHCPKPLLKVGEHSLLEHHLLRCKAAGIDDIVINLAYLGQKIVDAIGDGSHYGLEVQYSWESKPLETGGAINYALEHLGDDPFVLMNGDVYTDMSAIQLKHISQTLDALKDSDQTLAHLCLVENPAHNPAGDFCLDGHGNIQPKCDNAANYTYSGIACLSPSIIALYPHRRERFALKEVFDWAIEKNCINGALLQANWTDVGTPQRLKSLNESIITNL